MTALEEIKKALEGVTPSAWRITGTMPSGSKCWKVVEHEYQARIEALDWKQYSIVDVSPLYDSSTLESLRRENEELRKDREHVAAEKSGIAKNAHSNMDYWKSQFEAAEGAVKRYRVALIAAKTRMRNCRGAIESNQVVDKDVHGSLQNGIRDIQEALASTGGEHNGN